MYRGIQESSFGISYIQLHAARFVSGPICAVFLDVFFHEILVLHLTQLLYAAYRMMCNSTDSLEVSVHDAVSV